MDNKMSEVNSKNVTSPLLTIAIPTYNRASFLDLCLARIAEELNTLSADQRQQVKVYVSNNASTDNTTEVILRHRFMAAGGFDVVNNPENIGAERNVAECYTAATTPYVWVLGDDDLVLPKKLHLVLDVLCQQDVDMVYLNGYSYSENYFDEPQRGRGSSGVTTYGALDFVRRTHVMLTFITALIVRRGVKIEQVKQVIEGSNLPQLGWIFPLIRDGQKFAVIQDRVYAAKSGNTGGYGVVKVFGSNLKKIGDFIFKEQPQIANAIQNGTITKFFPILILSIREGSQEVGQFSDENMIVELKQVFGQNWRYYTHLLPLLKLPLFLARLYSLMLRLLNRMGGFLLI
jgi:abequosyltransferase